MGRASDIDRETGRPGLRAELFVTDVARAVAFYRDVLGMVVLRAAASGYTSVGCEGATLGLNDAARLPEDHPSRPRAGEPLGRGVELVVMVEDVAAGHARAVASGAGRVSALVRQPWGLTDFRVVDPDGYYIRVTGLSDAQE